MRGRLRLAGGEVHRWCVTLDVSPAASAAWYATLSEDERDRSARYRFERDRRRFTVARGVLRELLGRYLGADPGEIRFTYNAFGKPALSPEFGSRIKFNLSHSAGCALIGITGGADIGVDLERVRAQSDQAEIARRFFSPAEVDELGRLPGHLQAQAFLRYWTKREAYVKACGESLEDAASHDVAAAARWSVYTVHPAPDYIGALVVEGSGWWLREWHFRPPRRVPLPSPSRGLPWHARPRSGSPALRSSSSAAAAT